ncbi:MAG: glutamate synthase [Oscillospiraceae bacterium]|nr:glutamate synthase [Oscillospiraceae bacterium]
MKTERMDCMGQRYLGCGMADAALELHGTPGNALGAYLDGGRIEVFGNAQDATGDTMNGGTIVIHGSCGDAAGYAMRGGSIFVRGDVGYRAGVHMKAYADKSPTLVVGGTAGCFLGEYQAGGSILVLNLDDRTQPVGDFAAVGMYGGSILLRAAQAPAGLPAQVTARPADSWALSRARAPLEAFCACFGLDAKPILACDFIEITPDTSNPYKQMYVSV